MYVKTYVRTGVCTKGIWTALVGQHPSRKTCLVGPNKNTADNNVDDDGDDDDDDDDDHDDDDDDEAAVRVMSCR